MARISVEEIQKREQFLLKTFREQPELSAHAANDLLAKEFGRKMRPVRVFELKRTVSKARAGAGENGQDSGGRKASRGRGPGRPKGSKNKAKVTRRARGTVSKEVRAEVDNILANQSFVVLTGTGEEIGMIKNMLDVLKQSGAQVNVDENLADVLRGLTAAGLQPTA